MTSIANWFGETWRTYVGNATSQRDFRVQMRGPKTVLAWTLYLFVLLTVGYVTYASIGSQYGMTIVDAQFRMRGFFDSIIRVIAGAVLLIAPGLTAAGIVGERQRRSFDLLFSAPMTPKYFLVGKTLSSYRYTIMLLILAIPVVAISALVGGATWSDVLICFVMLSMSGLMLTAIALVISSVQEKVHSAIAASYLIAIAFTMVTSFLSTTALYMGSMRGPIREASFLSCLNPLFIPETYGTYTLIGTTKVPNWLLMVGLTLLIVRLCLLGAGSALSPYGSWETKSLRIQGLLYAALIGFVAILGYAVATPMSGGTTPTGKGVTAAVLLISLFIPWIAAAGTDGRRINELDKGFDLRRIWLGNPSGALPYLVALIVAFGVGAVLAGNEKGLTLGDIVPYLIHGLGVVLFGAGLTRLCCVKWNLQGGRRIATTLTVLIVWVLPLFLSFSLASSSAFSGKRIEDQEAWVLWPLWPLVMNHAAPSLIIFGIIVGTLGLVMGTLSTRALLGARTT